MQELLCSIHNYTKFSGGRASFYDMAQSALSVGLDAVFTTDKNIYPEGHSRLYYRDRKSVMILCGEELFDPIDKSVPRYLSLGIEKEQFGKKSAWSQEEIRISTEDPAGDSRFRHFELINAQELLYHGIDNAQEITRKKISAFESLLMNDLRCVGLAGTCSSQISTGHTFAELCVRRRVISAARAASRQKHAPLNDGVSLDELLSEEGSGALTDMFSRSPEDQLLERESAQDFLKTYSGYLSAFEAEILGHYLSGLSCGEIARRCGRSEKSVDNAVQRIRRKLAGHIRLGDFS